MRHVASRLFDTPLLVHGGKAAAIVKSLGPRITGRPIASVEGVTPVDYVAGERPLVGRLGDPLSASIPDRFALFRVGGVAVIPIEGTLVHKGHWIEAYSGETSYEGIQRQVTAARRDPQVRGVVLEVDSYGGELSGAFDTAEMIHDLAVEKPTIAILTDDAYSGGYLLASAARQIILPETGGLGSIGAVMLHTDLSQAFADAGIKVTIIAAGAHKADGNPYQPLPADVQATVQEDLEKVRATFAQHVARYREGRLSFEAAIATEADVYYGQDAVALGLADAVARPSEAFAEFVRTIDASASF